MAEMVVITTQTNIAEREIQQGYLLQEKRNEISTLKKNITEL